MKRVAVFLFHFFIIIIMIKRPFRFLAWEALGVIPEFDSIPTPAVLRPPTSTISFFLKPVSLSVAPVPTRAQRAVTELLSTQHWIFATPLCSLAKEASWESVPQHLRVCCHVAGKSERRKKNVSEMVGEGGNQ